MLKFRPITLSMGETPFKIYPTGALALEAWGGQMQERDLIEWLVASLAPTMTVFDVGSNVGAYAIPIAQRITSGKVYAFEPSRSTFSTLRKNLKLNSLSNVVPIQVALMDKVGKAQLNINVRGRDGLNTLGIPSHPESRVVGEESVRTSTIDEFIRAQNIGKVDVMKIDVEGAELFVLRGASGLLERSDAPLIILEAQAMCTAGFSYHPVELTWYLEQRAFKVFALSLDKHPLFRRAADTGFNQMMVAVKPSHALYARVVAELV